MPLGLTPYRHQRTAFSRLAASAGLYVGESERTPHTAMGPDHVITDRGTLRERPPDILLTNYKMLDFLLIRPIDHRLWRPVVRFGSDCARNRRESDRIQPG